MQTTEATTAALRKLLTDKKSKAAFKSWFNYSIEEYISSLFTDEETDEIVQSAAIITVDDDDKGASQHKDKEVQVITQQIIKHIVVKKEVQKQKSSKEQDKLRFLVA